MNSIYDASFLRTGLLMRFAPGTLFGDELHHFGVVMNGDGANQTVGIIIGATSQINKQVEFINKRGLSPYTLVMIEGNTHRHFGKKTVFKCNDPKEVPLVQIISWYKQGLIEIPDNPVIDNELLLNIQNGICVSDMVSDKVKRMLTQDDG